MTFSIFKPGTTLVVCALLGALASGLNAGPRSSLSDLDIETAEARLTLEKVLMENARLKEEVRMLQEKLAVGQATAARMTESLALSTGESEVFRRQAGELKLRLEALGIEGGATATSKVEQRFITALNDLRHADEDRTKLRQVLTGLSESAATFARSKTPDAESRKALEQQLRRANEALGESSPNAALAGAAVATLTDGMIINISDELALVVANLGAKQGVTAGMPFQVLRENHLIGTIRVIDVRERIAGAIVENLSSEKDHIKVGDRVKIAARQ